ncbi:NLP/P60 protein [Acidimicrobium ferrooxidans DSM 10331]|uniref:NLP/P60 protein n=1 Tax=Acidimicrobium ferrooxidans (strain DSM 10331 / JCM 15462 / NBRC 103882 / ICP) TaxID=525909 RepID=C7M213_ACIFD|nr:NlpC/P60 family protein [Acidimicrobium ferrooxidans]ACU53111.1 NLP/P60 protein [Acidimicrobium ferrooxidans DSM 10331]
MTMAIQSAAPPAVAAIEQLASTLSAAASAQGVASFESTLAAALQAEGQVISGTGKSQSPGSVTGVAQQPSASVVPTSNAPVDPFAGLTPVPPTPTAQTLVSTGGSASERATALAAATGEIGVPYVWGGSSPATGFDCSGLVQWAYAQAGVELPRTAAEQQTVGTLVPSLAAAQPGDLVFYGNPAYHVAIYAGNGMVVQAPMTGENVELAPVGTPTEIRDPTAVAPQPTVSSAVATPSDLTATFQAASAAYGLPTGMLEAVAETESNFNPNAVSSAGAEGIMQLMPQTAASLGVNPFDPTQAIWGAAKLLAGKLAHFGSVPLALAAYNAGDGAVEAYGGIPPYAQTQNYVRTVLSLMGGEADGSGQSTASA